MTIAHSICRTRKTRQNELLSVLLTAKNQSIADHLKLVNLPVGAVLRQREHVQGYAYFPNDALVSLVSSLDDGKSAEFAVVGSEGLVGIDELIGGINPCTQAKVQFAGTAFRVPTRVLKDALNCHDDVRWLMLRHMQSMFAQMSQAVICNRHHSLEQQLSRKLLTASDQLCDSELALTQGALGELLGVRREGVTTAAGALKKLGAIEYRRGQISILDRAALEQRSCECYAVIKAQCDRLRPGEFSTDADKRSLSPTPFRAVNLAVKQHDMFGSAAA